MQAVHRHQGLDCTKGIAIFAVVLFHVTRGFTSAGLLPEGFALRFADTLAYGFHVPTFFLIAGYLAFPGARSGGYQIRRQTWLYYAYLFWSLISWLLVAANAGRVNHPLDWHTLQWLPLVPIQHFWFIPVLMIGTALLGVLRSSALLLAAAALCLMLTHSVTQRHLGIGGWPDIFFIHSLPYILIGGWLRHSGLHLGVNMGVALICLVGYLISIWSATSAHYSLSGTADFPIILAGCYLAYVGGSLAARGGPLGTALAMLGRHSLTIYLVHVIAGAGMRILLHGLMPGLNVGISILLSLAAALGLPVLLEMAARRLGLASLLGFAPFSLGLLARRPATT